MRFRKPAPAPAPVPPPAVPPKRRTPWWLVLLLIIGALVAAQYLGCPVLTESESTEWTK